MKVCPSLFLVGRYEKKLVKRAIQYTETSKNLLELGTQLIEEWPLLNSALALVVEQNEQQLHNVLVTKYMDGRLVIYP